MCIRQPFFMSLCTPKLPRIIVSKGNHMSQDTIIRRSPIRLIIGAHRFLEKYTLSKWQQYWKDQVANWYGMFLYLVAPPARERVQRMRVCFQYADEQYLYVTPLEEVSEQPYLVRYNVPQINEEFAETCKLLWRHAQVNLLDVAIDEAGILTPSFIVLEPDYLLDISSLAECFRDYGHHPANYFLSSGQVSWNRSF